MAEYKFHEYANIFPMDEKHLGELEESIKQNGLHNEIELFEGKILDGRRRYVSCLKTGIEPRFKTINPDDTLAYVVDLNLRRRQLSSNQKIIVIARAEQFQVLRDKADADAKKRMREAAIRGNKSRGVKSPGPGRPALAGERRSRDDLGAIVAVSGRTVQRGISIVAKGTDEVIKAVEENDISLTAAEKIVVAHTKKGQSKALAEYKKRRGTKKNIVVDSISKKSTNGEVDKNRDIAISAVKDAINYLAHSLLVKKIRRDSPYRKEAFKTVLDWLVTQEKDY